MTDAFRCNGCGDYSDAAYQFLTVQMHDEAVRFTDFTFDDLPKKAFALLEGDLGNGEESLRADLCPDCGREALELLVAELDTEAAHD